MDVFGERLKALRTSLGLSQADLARAMGSEAQVVYQYERGKSKPSRERLKAIAAALGTTVGYLIGETDKSSSAPDPLPRIEPQREIDLGELVAVIRHQVQAIDYLASQVADLRREVSELRLQQQPSVSSAEALPAEELLHQMTDLVHRFSAIADAGGWAVPPEATQEQRKTG